MKTFFITLAALSLTLMSCNSQKQKTVTLGPNPFITHMYTADPSAHGRTDACMCTLRMTLIRHVGAI